MVDTCVVLAGQHTGQLGAKEMKYSRRHRNKQCGVVIRQIETVMHYKRAGLHGR